MGPIDESQLKIQARENFYKLRQKALLNSLVNIIRPNEHNKLLSFYDVRKLLGDKKQEKYLGLQVIPIKNIVGSEGRYQDFTRSFLPKANHLQERWVRIKTATQQDIILPPIQLFKVGDAYFIRDGNHRVSVARTSGMEMIDAEVTEVISSIYLSANMTPNKILHRMLEYEKNMILKETRLANFIDTTQLVVTATGSYSIIIQHIMGHKHFVEQEYRENTQSNPPQTESCEVAQISQLNPVLAELNDITISFSQAAQSWYENLFEPILKLIHQEGLLAQFPERTAADLYIWLISHWQDLKDLHGQDVPLEDAVISYSQSKPASLWQRFSRLFIKRKSFEK